MTASPANASLLNAFYERGILGTCVFAADGTVISVAGSASSWAPAPGRPIEDSAVFSGMTQAIADVRASGGPLSLAGLSIGGIDQAPIDIDVIWMDATEQFVALSRSASERVFDHWAATQGLREKRLLEEKIAEQQARIAEQAEMMALFVRHVPAAVAMLDADLQVVLTSERWKEEHGDPFVAEPGVETASPLTWPHVAARLRFAMDGGVPSTQIEKSSFRGRAVWKRLAQAPWRGADHQVAGTILFCEDVTDAMRKAENLRARVEDLHKLSAEMDNLGRAVADDLRAPLRQIDFFSRFLLDSNMAGLDARSQDYLTQIRSCVDRIDRMMAALDRYMRLSEREIALSKFDIGDAVKAAATELRDALSQSRVNLVIRETLSVEADLTLVSGLFRRLIDNAIKYAGAGSNIMIDCYEEAQGVLTRITDDGPGVPPHLRRRAFHFFERLNAPASIPGEGMGLAECRKIADLHGGAMTLDPDFDAGLRALVSLPKYARRGAGPPPALPRS